jgi:serine protease Do
VAASRGDIPAWNITNIFRSRVPQLLFCPYVWHDAVHKVANCCTRFEKTLTDLLKNKAQASAQPLLVLEHLTGPSLGRATWLAERSLNVMLRPSGLLDVSATEIADGEGLLVARLRRSDGAFEIEAVGDQKMWINGRPAERADLQHQDTIEFGEIGPISRVRLYRDDTPPRTGVSDIMSDAAAYLRSSRKPLGVRLMAAASQIVRRLAGKTTLLFRFGVIITLALIGFLAWQQSRINTLLKERIETGTAQLQGYAKLLADMRREALTPADLAKLRKDLSERMVTASERIANLEQRSKAIERVIALARGSILFLQGSYAFREKATGRMLRHAVGADGKPLILPNGIPLLTLEGLGPIAERQFTGTGFVVGDDGIIVTSRHVGQPWRHDTNVKALAGNGLEPIQIRFIGYFPHSKEGRNVTLLQASTTADLALLRLEAPITGTRGLKLADQAPKPGEDVVLIGYPAGIRSMLAHAGAEFIEDLERNKVTDFWAIAAKLAAQNRIVPLASRGIVGRVSEQSIVYDAETTYGGSGGPVMNGDGLVIAVNSAIIPEYGGSNFGVPTRELRRLLQATRTQ